MNDENMEIPETTLDGIKFDAQNEKSNPDLFSKGHSPITRPCNPESKEWGEYIISRFTTTELIDGKYPSLDGLRRVAEEQIGLFDSDISIIKPLMNNDLTVTAKCAITTKGYNHRLISAVADCTYTNCTIPPYSNFLTTIAENRAEARALRKLLRIKVVSWEEMAGNKPEVVAEVQKVDNDEMVSETQLTCLNTLAEQNGVNLNKMITLKEFVGETVYNELKKLPKVVASKLISALNEFNRKAKEVPEEIKL